MLLKKNSYTYTLPDSTVKIIIETSTKKLAEEMLSVVVSDPVIREEFQLLAICSVNI